MQPLYGVTEYWFKGTNTGHGAVWVSIRKRKLIRPHKAYWGCRTRLQYLLTRGIYIRVDWEYWNKEDPPHSFVVALVRIRWAGSERGWEEIIISSGTVYASINHPPKNPVLADLFGGRPQYHCPPELDFNKQYSREDIQWLIRVAKKGLTVGGGVE